MADLVALVLGLAQNLKKVDPALIKKRIVLARKNFLLERLKKIWYVKSEELALVVDEVSERIVHQLSHFSQLKEHYRQLKRERGEKSRLKSTRQEIASIRKS